MQKRDLPVAPESALRGVVVRSPDEGARPWKKVGKAACLIPRLLTSPFRILPDFIIVGAARCGTTSLYAWLTQHPCIAPAFRKETYFFDRTYRRGLTWYRAFFPTALAKHINQRRKNLPFVTGEATPDYIFHPHAPDRLARILPKARLIALLRNPVDRAYSFHRLQVARRVEPLSFEDAIDAEARRLHGELPRMLEDESYFSFARQNYSYLARGVYADQLERWMERFPREQILILSTEDVDQSLAATSAKLASHLNVPDWRPPKRDQLNATGYSEMRHDTRARLSEYFRPHNERLYKLLGRDLGWDR